MNILVHDLPEIRFQNPGEDFVIIDASAGAAPCRESFKCWAKNTGYCVYADKLQHSGAVAGSSTEIIVVSQLCGGGYSAPVKRFFDRDISDCSLFPTRRDRKTYHKNRYRTRLRLIVYFYGSCSESERKTAREYVKCRAVNMNAVSYEVNFAASAEDLRGYRL